MILIMVWSVLHQDGALFNGVVRFCGRVKWFRTVQGSVAGGESTSRTCLLQCGAVFCRFHGCVERFAQVLSGFSGGSARQVDEVLG